MVRFLAGFVAATAFCLAQTEKPLLLQQPALSKSQIAFVYAGDLWIVGRDGGAAKRLTTGVGSERDPVFSPDGVQIAFTGEYDGNTDAYLVPAAGGVPRRLTYHPSPDVVAGWTRDGKQVLFRSRRDSYSRFIRLFTIPMDGVFPTALPLPTAEEGSYSPDAARIAYVPIPRAFNAWKRYRGGMTAPIWLANLADSRVERVPRENSNDFNPMWVDHRVFFLSDRNGPVTLFAYDTVKKDVKQVVANQSLDIKSASAGPGGIVYDQFGTVWLYDLKSGKTRKISITVSGDMPEVRPRFVKVASRIGNMRLSPAGARAVFEARGEILTVPAEKGDIRNLTNSPATAERDPAWSPDGKRIAYFSDESGEYMLHLRAQNGMGPVEKIDLGTPPSFFYAPTWSPDSRKIAYIDKRLNVWYVDLEKKQPVKVDTDTYIAPPFARVPVWSPDSKWLAYSKQLENYFGAIFVYSMESGKTTQITDGMSDARFPVFDQNGKYLYFLASTDSGPAMGGAGEMSSFGRNATRSVYVAVLAKSEASPLAPESDEEKAAEEKEKKKDEEKKDTAKKEAPPVKVDFEGIGQRILAMPIPARNYIRLMAGRTGMLYMLELVPPAAPGPPTAILHTFDLSKRKFEKKLENLRGFELSANGEKMLYRQGDRWVIAPAAAPPKPGEGPTPPTPPPAGEHTLKLDAAEVRVDPRVEWRQIYQEAWRIERDFFYDPGLHGLNLKQTMARYEPYLESVAARSDLNYLFSEMMGELTVGHLYVGGGDTPEVKRVGGGLLGADYRVENGRYRFARVYNGENWNPELKAPLTQPGVNVTAGEYLLAVNGRELRAGDNLYSFFEGTADKSVVLRVGPDPTGANAREVTVVPVADEYSLRNLAWVEENRRKVEKMSGGRVAYVYMPNTAGAGYSSFNRYFFAQAGKQAVVIDERFNGGGALADYVVDVLRRQPLSVVSTREGRDIVMPFGAVFGPKAMIINEYAGSGGDAMPYYFRRSKLGPLIGKRTWGGLVGIASVPQLMDGGFLTAPNLAVWTPDGEWGIENQGVAPDIEVEFEPEAVREGRDPQLERAVEYVLDELKKNPAPVFKRPAYPRYHK